MNALSKPALGALELPQPYLLFLGDMTEPGFAKTAFGLRDWSPERCIGEYRLSDDTVSARLPAMTPALASANGARALVIGVANPGGVIPPHWRASLIEALEAGLDIVSGMHARLGDIPGLADAALRHGRRLIDVRVPPADIPVATGAKRTGRRLLTVGTDCALGKKYTALAIHRAMVTRGVKATFRATGQTGIMIAGGGLPMDAIVADFEAGAAEILSPDAPDDHWDVIEGQGSLFHPAYAGVSLGLLHGSQPDVIIVCHEPGRETVLGLPNYALPSIEETIETNLMLGRRTNPSIRCGGISLNTAALTPSEAEAEIRRVSVGLGLPATDPVLGGASLDRLIDQVLA